MKQDEGDCHPTDKVMLQAPLHHENHCPTLLGSSGSNSSSVVVVGGGMTTVEDQDQQTREGGDNEKAITTVVAAVYTSALNSTIELLVVETDL